MRAAMKKLRSADVRDAAFVVVMLVVVTFALGQ